MCPLVNSVDADGDADPTTKCLRVTKAPLLIVWVNRESFRDFIPLSTSSTRSDPGIGAPKVKLRGGGDAASAARRGGSTALEPLMHGVARRLHANDGRGEIPSSITSHTLPYLT